MPEQLNITNIPSNRIEFIDPRTGLVSREWYRFFLNLFNLAGAGSNQISLDELQIGPPPMESTGSGGGGTGTVTSVAMSVPTGLSVAGSPITSSGTLAVTYSAGYAIPTTASQTNWDTAYADRLKWDGGATDLVAATGRTSLGGTTVGSNMFTLTNPSAITFPQFNADNTVSALDAASFRTAIGAGTGTVAIANGGTGQTSQTAAFDALSPTTTKGDLIVSNGTDNVRLAVGTDAYVLTADAASAAGVKWAVAGSSSNNITAKGMWENALTISTNYTITSGNSAMSAGPITIASGVVVTVPSGSRWVVV